MKSSIPYDLVKMLWDSMEKAKTTNGDERDVYFSSLIKAAENGDKKCAEFLEYLQEELTKQYSKLLEDVNEASKVFGVSKQYLFNKRKPAKKDEQLQDLYNQLRQAQTNQKRDLEYFLCSKIVKLTNH